MVATTLVVPCYNEELRLPEAEYVSWLAGPAADADVRLLFVDDGSRDGTVRVPLPAHCRCHRDPHPCKRSARATSVG